MLKLKQGEVSGSYGSRSWTNKDEVIPENKVDSAKVKDIDFSLDKKLYKKLIRFWKLKIDGDKPIDEEEKKLIENDFYKKEYYKDKYGTKENYARLLTTFSTYAVITPDGQWHGQGQMGWFGMGSESDEDDKKWIENFKKEFINKADPEWIMTIVDCHI